MSAVAEEQLSLSSLHRVPDELKPALDPRALSIGIVHFGIGAFHRAHQTVYTEEAARATGEACWGICGVSHRSPTVPATLTAQDGLYSLRVISAAGSHFKLYASLREARFAGPDPSPVLARIADPATQVLSITVTEKGYRHDPATGHLRRDDATLLGDVSGDRAPLSVLGVLARGLEARLRAGGGPVSVLCCDNLPANGRLLSELLAELRQLPGARFDPGLEEFLAEQVRLPSSMVDRIVPAATPELFADATRHLGVRDEAAVSAEPFSTWVIEDDFAGRRPAWERAGALLVTDVAPYETLKLRVLNGSHSALAYLGVLAGAGTIAEALQMAGFEELVAQLVDEEIGPTVAMPPGVELWAYRDEVLERFSNPALPHRCSQVAMDGSLKLGQRLLDAARDCLAAGRVPRLIALVVAAWVQSLRRERDDRSRPLAVEDPIATRLAQAVGSATAADEVARRVLGLSEVFDGELAGDEGFRVALGEGIAFLGDGGTAAKIASAAFGARQR